MTKLFRLLLSIVLLTIMVGCGTKPPPPGERPLIPSAGWDLAWIDPQIVVGTDMCTLIRAGRIDSLQVEVLPAAPKVPTLVFEIPDSSCIASINLLNERGSVVQPLVLQRLAPGFYKLSLSPSGLRREGILPGVYILAVDWCQFRRRDQIIIP